MAEGLSDPVKQCLIDYNLFDLPNTLYEFTLLDDSEALLVLATDPPNTSVLVRYSFADS